MPRICDRPKNSRWIVFLFIAASNQEVFSSPKNFQRGSGAHIASYSMNTGVFFPDSKVAEFRNEWSYTRTPCICLHIADR